MSSIRIVAGILLVISLIGIYIGWNIHSDFNYEPLGPRPFPVGTLILIALCSIFLVFSLKILRLNGVILFFGKSSSF
ncbi:hypothetical protein I9Q68_08755 [Campylobacter coli]|nr:hypothetical protein [Campylobacter coli]EIX7250660.1 hypothetical protein [Campylobacter coli]EJD3821547.1 hypothetical protein [Campylobacter coli]EKM8555077.1 hypothetical protein [Campylobacter coli]EKM8556145.1 hypothetical protein [Campylobacter coli]